MAIMAIMAQKILTIIRVLVTIRPMGLMAMVARKIKTANLARQRDSMYSSWAA